MQTTRTPYTQSNRGNYSNSAPQPRKDYFGLPEFNDRGTRFSLAPKKRGRSEMSFDTSGFANPYFGGGSNKRFRDDIASSIASGYNQNFSGTLDPATYGGFGKPSFDQLGTIGFMSNHTVPGNETVMYTPDNADEVPGINDVAILRVSNPKMGQRWGSAAGLVQDLTPRESYTLASFNRMLAMNQKKVTTFEDLLPPENTSQINWNDPISIMSHFYIYGVVNASETKNNRSATPRVTTATNRSGSETRNSGVTISGRDQAYNVWGPGVISGNHLFFILKPHQRPRAYVTNSYNPNSRSVRVISEAEAASIKDKPFQLVPYVGELNHPPDSMLMYQDELGRTQKAPYVFFATCFKTKESTRDGGLDSLFRDISLVRKQGLVDIIVHV